MKCCDMHGGMLREPVTIQEPGLGARDDVGGYTDSWDLVANLRAYVKPLSGAEQFYAQRLQANASVRVTIRYRSDLTEDMRILIRTIPYQIRYIENMEFRNRWTTMLCERGEPT